MTKPGNSDHADRPVDAKEPAGEPTPESNGEAATDTKPKPEPEPTPELEAVAEKEEPAERVVAEPVSAEFEKAPPVPDESTPESNGEAATDTTPEPGTKPEPMSEPTPEPEAVAEKEEPAERVVAEPVSAAGFEKAPPVPDEPVMPTAAEAARRRSDLPRPKVLRIAFYLAIASAVVGIYSAIELFLNKADLVRSAQTIKTPNPLTPEEAERAVTSLLWLYLVVVVVLGAFITLFVYKAQDGVRRARMMAMIVTLILLIFHFYFFGTAFGQISGLFGAITIALLYLPSTREYFGPRQTVR